jgi:hypothetical protein
LEGLSRWGVVPALGEVEELMNNPEPARSE